MAKKKTKIPNSFGPHLMIDLKGVHIDILADLDLHFEFLKEMPQAIGMTSITQPHVFRYDGLVPEDKGITGTVIIAESHISIHSFQEKGYSFIDIFSCKPFDTKLAMKLILTRFNPHLYDAHIHERGLDFPRRK